MEIIDRRGWKVEPQSEDGPQFNEYRVLVPAPMQTRATSVLDVQLFNVDMEAEWAAHFARLSDEELAALTPEDTCAGLFDRAARLTRAYRAEVERRKQ